MHIPAAIVDPISRTANLPSCGSSLTFSMTIGLVGLMTTMAASPDLRNVGFSSLVWPDAGVEFLLELDERAGGLGGVAVEDRGVPDGQCARVLEHDDLCGELVGNRRRGLDGSADIAAADVALADTADVEPDVVTGNCLRDLFVVHLDGLDLSILVGGHEGDFHSLLHDTGLNTADRHGADTADAVHVLDRQAEGLVGRFLGFLEGVECRDEGQALVPGRLGAVGLDVVPRQGH